ncbi:MAG: OB-fold nucleic acid binding domain-containing protein [Verrucomicrobiota bacterium]|nr:OB-fold nucleic acid binding domain-containing protein [Verrucomicrobiota bacterium]
MTAPETEPFQGATCPGCDRFIGPADACPYCGADSAKAPILRHLRYAALALAAVGLLFLYLMARHSEPPLVRVAEVSSAMNFAKARVAGVVAGVTGGRRGGETNYVAFYLLDEDREIQVRAYRDVARELAETGRIPARGSRVEVTGDLRVAADGRIRLNLLSSDHIRPAGNAGPATAAPTDGRLRKRAP